MVLYKKLALTEALALCRHYLEKGENHEIIYIFSEVFSDEKTTFGCKAFMVFLQQRYNTIYPNSETGFEGMILFDYGGNYNNYDMNPEEFYSVRIKFLEDWLKELKDGKETPVKVIFRKDKNGYILVVFPEITEPDGAVGVLEFYRLDSIYYTCINYDFLIKKTTPAKEKEYCQQREILRTRFGYDLRIITKKIKNI
jgi:hypothetical protein